VKKIKKVGSKTTIKTPERTAVKQSKKVASKTTFKTSDPTVKHSKKVINWKEENTISEKKLISTQRKNDAVETSILISPSPETDSIILQNSDEQTSFQSRRGEDLGSMMNILNIGVP
jgi:hypothetical protein